MINSPKLKTNFAEGDDFIGTIINYHCDQCEEVDGGKLWASS